MRTGSRFARSLALGAGLGLLGLFGAACDFECLADRCANPGLNLSATRADGEALTPGVYSIWLGSDGEEFKASCDLESLADGSCAFTRIAGDQASPELSVAGDDMPRDIRIDWLQADKSGNNVDLSGPSLVALQIELDGVSIAAAELAPQYNEGQATPTVGACGACERAEIVVELDSPT